MAGRLCISVISIFVVVCLVQCCLGGRRCPDVPQIAGLGEPCLRDEDCSNSEICCSNICTTGNRYKRYAPPCPTFNCTERGITCPNGFVIGVDGCQLSCECDGCPRIECNLNCEHGFRTDADHCPVCGCNPPPGGCEVFNCAERGITCPNGFVFGVDGCQLGCGCDGCPRLENCDISCPHGFATDADRCPTCACKPPPGGCEVFNCAERGITCPNGFVFGVDGCQLGCGCDGCPRLSCTGLSCPLYGFKVDRNRCPICQCNRSGGYYKRRYSAYPWRG